MELLATSEAQLKSQLNEALSQLSDSMAAHQSQLHTLQVILFGSFPYPVLLQAPQVALDEKLRTRDEKIRRLEHDLDAASTERDSLSERVSSLQAEVSSAPLIFHDHP